MSYTRQRDSYREAEVLSSSPERLIPLLYEHLLVNLKRGGRCIRKGDIDGKFHHLSKAADIVAELIGALDFEAGGEIALRLGSLYAFWAKEISIAARALEADRLDAIVELVDSLRASWVEAVRVVEGAADASPPDGVPA